MIRCDEAIDLICILQDEELNEGEKKTLQEHLDNCASCRDFQRTMAHLSELLNDPEPLPKGLHAKIMDSIDAEIGKRKTVSIFEEKQKRGWKWKQVSVLAACLIFALLFGFRSSSITRRSNSTVSAVQNASSAAEQSDMERPEEKEMLEEPAAFLESAPAPAPYPSTAIEGTSDAGENHSASAAKLLAGSEAAMAAGSDTCTDEAEKKPILLDDILPFLKGEPVISLEAADVTAPDDTIPVIVDGEEKEMFLWEEESGLLYSWNTADGWLYRSEHTIEEFYNFMNTLTG